MAKLPSVTRRDIVHAILVFVSAIAAQVSLIPAGSLTTKALVAVIPAAVIATYRIIFPHQPLTDEQVALFLDWSHNHLPAVSPLPAASPLPPYPPTIQP